MWVDASESLRWQLGEALCGPHFCVCNMELFLPLLGSVRDKQEHGKWQEAVGRRGAPGGLDSLGEHTVLYVSELTVMLNLLHVLVLSSTSVPSLRVLGQVGWWDTAAPV